MKIRSTMITMIAVLGILALFAVAPANAQDWIWAGGEVPRNWTDAEAWSGGNGGNFPGHETNQGVRDAFGGWIPGMTTVDLTINTTIPETIHDHNNFGLVGSTVTVRVLSGGSIDINNVYFGRNEGVGNLIVDGGLFTNDNGLFFGQGGDNDETIGTFHVLGGGQIQTNGALLMEDWGSEPDSVHVATGVIDDGLVHVQNLNIRNPGDNQNITLNHVDAIFRWNGDRVDTMNTLIGNGGLRAGTGMEWVEGGPVYDAGLGYTELRVIPEPGTIALLGLAGLVMLIRRRFVK